VTSNASGASLDGGSGAARQAKRHHRLIDAGWLLAALTLCAAVYFPITRSYFFADDFLNLYGIVNDRPLQYLVTPNGGHMLMMRNAIFYLTFQLFGPQPQYYYWSVFLTHLLNVYLLFRLVRLVTDSARLASFGAALWGISPSNEGTLGWYSVYGHVLVATALLLILHQAQRLATRGCPQSRTQWWWCALALGAATSFGTGIVVALLLPFVLLLLLPGWPARSWRRPPLASLLIAVPALYVSSNLLYTRLSGIDPLGGTAWRTLLGDLHGIAIIWAHLIATGVTRLLLGFWFPSWAGPRLWYTVLAGFVVALCLIARTSPAPVRRWLAACTILVSGCYGLIAAARAVIILKLTPQLETTPPRYQYVAQLILTLMLCLMLARMGSVLHAWAKRLLLVAWYGLTLFSHARFAPPIDVHERARVDTRETLAAMEATARRSPPGEPVYIRNQSFKPLPFLPALFPGWAAAFVIFHPGTNTLDGRQIYFVEENPGVIDATKHGKRTATLFVPHAPSAAAAVPARPPGALDDPTRP
jgi:hypothetical protein